MSNRRTRRPELVLPGRPDSSTLDASPSAVSLSLLPPTLGPLQPPLQGLDLLPAPRHLFQKTVLHQPGDLIHGSLEDRFHDARELGLKCHDRLSHDANYVSSLRPVVSVSSEEKATSGLHLPLRSTANVALCKLRCTRFYSQRMRRYTRRLN